MLGLATESKMVGLLARRSVFWSHRCWRTLEICCSITASSGTDQCVEPCAPGRRRSAACTSPRRRLEQGRGNATEGAGVYRRRVCHRGDAVQNHNRESNGPFAPRLGYLSSGEREKKSPELEKTQFLRPEPMQHSSWRGVSSLTTYSYRYRSVFDQGHFDPGWSMRGTVSDHRRAEVAL